MDCDTCDVCKRPIGYGQKRVHYQGRLHHQYCLVCHYCNQPVGVGSLKVRDEKVCCMRCQSTSSFKEILCATCKTPVDGGLEFQGEIYHEDCFKCSNCPTVIGRRLFQTHGGKPYCESCYTELFSQRCCVCRRPITHGWLSFKGENYHHECFTCNNCHSVLPSQQFYVKENFPYCEKCYTALFFDRCIRCDLPLTGSYKVFDDKKYHLGCFKCDTCGRILEATYPRVGGGLACIDHVD